mmetsp:Transcript_58624/g.162303  ORF Transcript_58624/g.162303 Transcript_58624/m.162303 type:complete len:245 (+) Transcript_58624:1-735(+)
MRSAIMTRLPSLVATVRSSALRTFASASASPSPSFPVKSYYEDGERPAALEFAKWVDEVGPTLAPPVANKMVFGKGFLKVMVVGGPNVRKDYHLQAGEEFFWQLKGTLSLHVVMNGMFQTVTVPEGHCFLLPARVPHSPRRSANSIGVVIERGHEHTFGDSDSVPAEIDGLRWYVDDIEGAEAGEGAAPNGVLYEEYFKCYDLGQELGPVIGRFAEFQEAHGQAVMKEGEARGIGEWLVVGGWW